MKIICIGRNYNDHVAELGSDRPDCPVIFMKPETALLGDGRPFPYPAFSNEVHHEIELLVKIGKDGSSVPRERAHEYYDEIGVGIDFTARDLQDELKKKGLPWEKAKAFDRSALVSKFVSRDGRDMQDITIKLDRNGQTAQVGNSGSMLWPVDTLIAEVSRFFTLEKGDILFTGTPAGVGPVQVGDTLKGFLEGKEMFQVDVVKPEPRHSSAKGTGSPPSGVVPSAR